MQELEKHCGSFGSLLQYFTGKQAHEQLETDLAYKIIETLGSRNLALRWKTKGLGLSSSGPYKLSDRLELRSWTNALCAQRLIKLKVYLMTKLAMYKERQQESTAYQPKD